MRIGVLTHNYPRFRGDFSGRFVEALSEELVAQGHNVTVIAPWDPAFDPSIERGVDLRTYRYALRDRWHTLGYMRTMRADVAMRASTYLFAPGLFAAGACAVMHWVAEARPDVLHAHWVLPNGFLGALAARRFGIPLVVSIPGSDATVAGQNPLFKWMSRFAFRQAGLITANAESLQEAATTSLGADPRRFELIPYGVDPKAFFPDSAGVAELRRSVGIPDGALVLLAVGRMVYKKGFDGLLRAAALVTGNGPAASAHLLMIGEGDLLVEWQTMAKDLGLGDRVHWVGNVPTDRMSVYYNAADIAVMPATSRPATGLAVTVLDAMSCAKPVIGSDAAGNRLAIRQGENGLIVPEGDDRALADAIVALASDEPARARMGAAGRRLIDEELGWPQLAARYASRFQRLRGEGR